MSVGPVDLALIYGLITLLLIVNGFFETRRTRKSLTEILESQGRTLAQGLEKEIQSTLSVITVMESVPGGHLLNPGSSIDFFAIEDAVVDYLLEIAARVDQDDARHAFRPVDLERLAQKHGVERIEILEALSDPRLASRDLSLYLPLFQGIRDMTVDPFREFPPDPKGLFSVLVRRVRGRGIITVSINPLQMKILRRRFAIEDVLEAMDFGDRVEYVSVFDTSLAPIAQVGKEGLDRAPDLEFLRSVQESAGSASRLVTILPKKPVFEVAKAIRLGETPYGVIEVGLSTLQIQKIVSLSRRNAFLWVTVFLAVGITGVTLIYVNQNRHIRRVREMEERAQAAERLLSVGKLGAGLAHEIRNPLNAIAMAIQRLHREFHPRDGEEAGQYDQLIRVIREEINRLNRIVERFLLFSKPRKLALTPVRLAEMLRDISLLFLEEAEVRSVAVKEEVDPMLPPVMMDREGMSQALVNIVTNGLDAMEGGGTLTIRAEPVRRDWVRITVADTGKGIPEEQIERVFDYSYTSREKGLGLGLPMARKIIEEHGGRVDIESRVGEGTSISILLPLKGP